RDRKGHLHIEDVLKRRVAEIRPDDLLRRARMFVGMDKLMLRCGSALAGGLIQVAIELIAKRPEQLEGLHAGIMERADEVGDCLAWIADHIEERNREEWLLSGQFVVA